MSRLFVLTCLTLAALHAEVRLPAVLSDHMLIQRDIPVRIWGKADAGEKVSVRFQSQSVATTADPLGAWSVSLAPVPAGGPYELTVEGTNTITIKDILVGDVWVASGQSNMQWPTNRAANAQQEIAAANHPNLRLFKVALKTSDYPLDDVSGSWSPCSPESVSNFTAVGYFFGRDLHKKLNIPVGVIQTAWGGTPADAWTSTTALASDPALISVFSAWAEVTSGYPKALARYEAQARTATDKKPNPPSPPSANPGAPGSLFNAMIAPLTPYAIRGAIWYQGESNATQRRAYTYRRLFQAMINDWRHAWNQGDFPFLFVQLANFKTTSTFWPELREAQTMALRLANTGMAVTIDIGAANDIHPINKQDVGNRLALAARAVSYGEKLVYSGPLYRQTTREGGALRVWFDHTGSGLMAKGGELRGFTIAGSKGEFVPARARIENNTVVVSSDQVAEPLWVRYAWLDDPDCNLFNNEGLPASPFRNDEIGVPVY